MKLGVRGTKLVKIVLPGRVCLDRGPGTPQFSKFATNSLESIFGGVGWPGPQGRVWGGLEGALKKRFVGFSVLSLQGPSESTGIRIQISRICGKFAGFS